MSFSSPKNIRISELPRFVHKTDKKSYIIFNQIHWLLRLGARIYKSEIGDICDPSLSGTSWKVHVALSRCLHHRLPYITNEGDAEIKYGVDTESYPGRLGGRPQTEWQRIEYEVRASNWIIFLFKSGSEINLLERHSNVQYRQCVSQEPGISPDRWL